VSFLERLRDFLRHPVPLPDADLRYRQRFLAVLEQREAQGAEPDWLHQRQSRFGSRLELFTDVLSAELLAQGIPPPDVPALVDTGIALALDIDAQAATFTRTRILRKAVELALEEVHVDAQTRFGEEHSGWGNVSRYAREIQAVRQERDRMTVTAIGRMLLELAGREAVKWLLHVEVALSTGRNDPWRVSRRTLQTIASRDPSEAFDTLSFLFSPEEAPSSASLDRMAALGLLELVDEHSYRVLPHAGPILGEFAEGRDTPMSILVQALLEDEVRGLLPEKHGAPATTAAIRQARLIVHELRNTIIPIQVALEGMDRAVRAAGITQQVSDHRHRVGLGLKRLLSVADEFDRLARASGETPDVFDASSTVREAASIVAAELGHHPTLSLPESLPSLMGIRTRFVLALVNLLRNAYQAMTSQHQPQVALNAEQLGEHVHFTVDDNGPGIAPEQRAHVFMNGYSMRAGGSGHGLTLVRSTVEEMAGTLSCEDGSSLGGARFVIRVPIYRRKP
jgi:signal transduction histidine kinase